MGVGSGLVTLELSWTGAAREGVDIIPECVAFATANAELRSDAGARFYQSDLFSNVHGKFDLIMFNAWQPCEEYLDVIVRFLAIRRKGPSWSPPCRVEKRPSRRGRLIEVAAHVAAATSVPRGKAMDRS
jgi:hypothetical protein